MYTITNHSLFRLKQRGIVPFHFTCRDIDRFLMTQINQINDFYETKHKVVTKNNAVLILDGHNVLTGYWNRRLA